jgi:hypothetical protein
VATGQHFTRSEPKSIDMPCQTKMPILLGFSVKETLWQTSKNGQKARIYWTLTFPVFDMPCQNIF